MVAWIRVAVGGEMFRMYLEGRTSGTVELGVGREADGKIEEDSQVSSLKNWMDGSAVNQIGDYLKETEDT